LSRFHPLDISAVRCGQTINASVERNERGAYLRELDVVGSAPGGENPPAAAPSTARRAMRCSGDAAIFAAGRPDMKSGDVLTLTERWLAWLGD
jgi:hypothetical protein